MAKKNNKSKKKPKIDSGIKKQLVRKEPRRQVELNNFQNQYPVWQLNLLDKDGKWGWSVIGKNRWEEKILPKLCNFETMNWSEIENSGSHFIDTNIIIKEAQKRLVELNMDDLDQIFSLRLEGRLRLFGKRIGNILQIMWFDFEHEICPSKKKHT